MIRLLSCGDPIFSVPSRAAPPPPPPATTTTTATAMPQGGKVYSYTISTIQKKNICSALQASVCYKNRRERALWAPPLNQPMKRIKKGRETPEKRQRIRKYRAKKLVKQRK